MILYPFLSCTILQRNAYIYFRVCITINFHDILIPQAFLDFSFWFLLFAKTYDQKLELRKVWERAKSTEYFWATLWMNSYQLPHFVTWPPTHFIAQFFFRVNSHAVSHWRGYYVLHNSSPLPLLCAPLGLVSVAIIIISVCISFLISCLE